MAAIRRSLFAYEGATTRNGRSSSLVTVPNDAFRNGDLRGLVDSSGKQIPLYDPVNASGGLIQDATQRPRLACNGVLNVICPNRISPLAQALMANMVEPDNPNLITNNTRSYTTSSSKSHVYSIKGDYVLGEKHRVSFIYSHYFSLPNRISPLSRGWYLPHGTPPLASLTIASMTTISSSRIS